MRAADLHRLSRTLRDIALEATGNTGPDRVNAGELAVLEDIAHHPRSTIGDITARTGLAQSLVSRIVRAVAAQQALSIEPDPTDGRKVRVELATSTRETILHRAGNGISHAIATHASQLTDDERTLLEQHLEQVADLLRRGTERSAVVRG